MSIFIFKTIIKQINVQKGRKKENIDDQKEQNKNHFYCHYLRLTTQ